VIRSACPADSKLVTRLKEIEEGVSKPKFVELPHQVDQDAALESEYRQLMREAAIYLQYIPVETPDESLEREVQYILKDTFFQSRYFRSITAVVAIMFLLVAGGTIFYGSEIRGFAQATNEAMQELQKIGENAREDAESKIAQAYLDTTQKLQGQLDTYERELDEGIKKFKDEVGDPNKRTGALGEIATQKTTLSARSARASKPCSMPFGWRREKRGRKPELSARSARASKPCSMPFGRRRETRGREPELSARSQRRRPTLSTRSARASKPCSMPFGWRRETRSREPELSAQSRRQ